MVHPVANFVVEYFYWVFIAILVVNLLQRKYRQEAQRKRLATLFLAIIVFAFFIYAYGVVHFNVSDLFLIPYVVVAVGLSVIFRQTVFPFAFRCAQCRQSLSFNRIAYFDDNLCETCAAKAHDAGAEGSADDDS